MRKVCGKVKVIEKMCRKVKMRERVAKIKGREDVEKSENERSSG